jgi:uncharacterized protein YdaU (DUF1376 family)
VAEGREPPYPGDTRARGWRFELDYEQIEQSDTWDMAAEIPMAQHALLMMWLISWRQEPCGSLPNDEAVIRAKCRMPPKVWAQCRDVLMRGWWLASDGRLYHDTIAQRVLAMLDKRANDAQRAATRRARKLDAAATPPGVTPESRVTHAGVPPEFDTKHQAPSTLSKDKAPTELVGLPAAEHGYRVPNCPHEDIVAAYAAVLPMLPQVAVLSDQRKSHVTARWRAVCADQKFTREQGVEWFRDYFGNVALSPFLTGSGKPDRATGRVWAADFDWLMLPTNFVKVVEGRYLERKAA